MNSPQRSKIGLRRLMQQSAQADLTVLRRIHSLKLKHMGDITFSRLIIFKGFLFLFAGIVAASVLLGENFSLRTAFLLGVAIWCFCRFYYFAFYVLEKYVDPGFKFSSLWAFGVYFWKRWQRK